MPPALISEQLPGYRVRAPAGKDTGTLGTIKSTMSAAAAAALRD
ncbi:hypothetical protein [Amycolatopsis granulosa]|nr:hypothetical protein [Amycolatopsis granulosa]